MEEQTQQSSSQQPSVADKIGYPSRRRPKQQETDDYTYKSLIQSYDKYDEQFKQATKKFDNLKLKDDYNKFSELVKDKRKIQLRQFGQQAHAPLMDLIGKNKNIQFKKIWSSQPSFEEWKKGKKGKYRIWKGLLEDINGDNFPEFVIRDNEGFIHAADGLRITIPIKCERVTKQFNENSIKAERFQKHYKQWKEEDKPVEDYRHFIKKYLSSFLKERSYTVAQVYSVTVGRIWKGVIAPWFLQYYDKSYYAQQFVEGDGTSLAIYMNQSRAKKQAYNQYFIVDYSQQRENQMQKLLKVCYTGFWSGDLVEIPNIKDEQGNAIFEIPSAQDIKTAKVKRDAKRKQEQEQYDEAMAKIRARKLHKLNE
ncbi:MAG: hypothetical protein EZS28_036921 [Streblomastix strix]|uniref:Uncharacterized protein n=1 Tax=Streblomastix strix TaxID=222440 RepID=A0A5J4UCF9_9EUKA|nr:MAG: hypothetical protein EZS28_036921 [Streblomastix strix]